MLVIWSEVLSGIFVLSPGSFFLITHRADTAVDSRLLFIQRNLWIVAYQCAEERLLLSAAHRRHHRKQSEKIFLLGFFSRRFALPLVSICVNRDVLAICRHSLRLRFFFHQSVSKHQGDRIKKLEVKAIDNAWCQIQVAICWIFHRKMFLKPVKGQKG